MNFVNNVPIQCHFCQYNPVMGQESETPMRDGNILHECRWVCPRCGQVVRRDENVIPNEKK